MGTDYSTYSYTLFLTLHRAYHPCWLYEATHITRTRGCSRQPVRPTTAADVVCPPCCPPARILG